jgi:hypothetical protein
MPDRFDDAEIPQRLDNEATEPQHLVLHEEAVSVQRLVVEVVSELALGTTWAPDDHASAPV